MVARTSETGRTGGVREPSRRDTALISPAARCGASFVADMWDLRSLQLEGE
jgi:hypothetical protein